MWTYAYICTETKLQESSQNVGREGSNIGVPAQTSLHVRTKDFPTETSQIKRSTH